MLHYNVACSVLFIYFFKEIFCFLFLLWILMRGSLLPSGWQLGVRFLDLFSSDLAMPAFEVQSYFGYLQDRVGRAAEGWCRSVVILMCTWIHM